mmetsp:Transcript_28839/g.72338  ORF Transcript_28839/g.72338 Transcript_28839/m.72338 type:complete len:287 (+) Transcript_28839:1765-2625(+)
MLGNTLQGELVHEVDDIRLLQEFVLEVLHSHREGSRVQQNLALWVEEGDELLDDGLELGREQLISLIHDKHVCVVQLGHLLVGEVEDSTRRGHDDVHCVVQAHDVVLEGGAAGGDHHLDAQVPAELLAHLRRLQRQLASGHEQHCLDLVLGSVHLLKHRDGESGGLAGAILGTGEDVTTCERDRDALLLDGAGPLEALLVDAHQQLPLEKIVLEVVALGGSHVRCPHARVPGREPQIGLPVLAAAARCRRGPAVVYLHACHLLLKRLRHDASVRLYAVTLRGVRGR